MLNLLLYLIRLENVSSVPNEYNHFTRYKFVSYRKLILPYLLFVKSIIIFINFFYTCHMLFAPHGYTLLFEFMQYQEEDRFQLTCCTLWKMSVKFFVNEHSLLSCCCRLCQNL